MAYTLEDFRTKKALKEAVASGRDVRCYNPGLGPDLTNYTGTVFLEGPHYPQPHKWYAKVDLASGKVIKIT